MLSAPLAETNLQLTAGERGLGRRRPGSFRLLWRDRCLWGRDSPHFAKTIGRSITKGVGRWKRGCRDGKRGGKAADQVGVEAVWGSARTALRCMRCFTEMAAAPAGDRRVDSPPSRRLQVGLHWLNLDELEMAAILAAGHGAVLSHTSAARRLGLDVPRSGCVEVTIPASRKAPKLIGVQVSRSRNLIETDTTRRGPFRLTHLARTMIDLPSVLDDGWLRAALDSALRQRKTNLAWISPALNNYGKGRGGMERLRELGLATGRKPRLHWNIVEHGRLIAEVDFAWPEVRLCVELDGWREHGTRAAFVRDRARDRALLRLGWMVIRYTWHEVTSDQEFLISELKRCRHWRPAPPGRVRRWKVDQQQLGLFRLQPYEGQLRRLRASELGVD